MHVTAETPEAVKTVFVELFCARKSYMENPSLRVNGHRGSMNRTFIVKIMLKSNLDNGPETKKLVSKVPLEMKGSVFGQGTTTTTLGSPDRFKAQCSEEKVKQKEKRQGGFKGTGRVFNCEEHAHDPEWWSKEKCAWWSIGERSWKAFSKGKNLLSESGFRTYQPEKEYSQLIKNLHKGRGKDQKGKGKEGAYTQSGFSASETPSEEGYGHAWESMTIGIPALTDDSSCSSLRGTTALYGTGRTAWMASVRLNLANHPMHVVLDLGCTRSIGSRAAMQKVSETCVVFWHYHRVLPLQ